jgi:anaphase-promoting complex subunit 1
MLILGKVEQGAGLSDMQITNQLLKIVSQNDFKTARHGATISLGLVYLKTQQTAVAEKLFLPLSVHDLDRFPPDLILLRVISKNLILWDNMKPSKEWMVEEISDFLKLSQRAKEGPLYRAYLSILAGQAFSLGLKYAGSANAEAFAILLDYYQLCISLPQGKLKFYSCIRIIFF